MPTRRGHNGCYTCRLRGKNCDVDIPFEQNSRSVPCNTCQRLQIECTGYGEEYPDWMRNEGRTHLRRMITRQLIMTGHVRGGNLFRTSGDHAPATEGILRLSPPDVTTPSFPASDSTLMQDDPMDSLPVSGPELASYGAHQSMNAEIDNNLGAFNNTQPNSNQLIMDIDVRSGPEQYPAENAVLIHYNPVPLRTVWDPRSFLLTIYYQKVFSRAYMLVDPSMMDKIAPVIESDTFAQNSVCLLAATFLTQTGSRIQIPDELRGQLMHFSDHHLSSRDRNRPFSAGEALGALQLISNSLFAAGVHPWKKYLIVAFNYVHPIITTTAVCNLDPSTLFIAKITGWFCVLAAIFNEFRSDYLQTFRALFDIGSYVGDFAERYMGMSEIMGADCRTLWALADITDLAQAKSIGAITEDEILRRGEKIQRRLWESYVPYSQSQCDADSTGIQGQRWCTGELFRLSALLYYFAVIYDHNPYHEDVARCVDDMIHLILVIHPSSITSRMCVLGIFLCGALYRHEGQRMRLEQFLYEACADGVGNSRAVLEVLKEIWEERERNPDADKRVNWREPLKRKRLLLVPCPANTRNGFNSDSNLFDHRAPTPPTPVATPNIASTQDDLREDVPVADPEPPSSEYPLLMDDGSGTSIGARSYLHEAVRDMNDCEVIPRSEQRAIEDIITVDNESGPSSSQPLRDPDIQQQYHTVTEWLTYWKISGVADLTDKIEISNQEEPSVGGFSKVFKGFYNTDQPETRLVAIKKLNIKSERNSSTERALRLYKRLAREVRVWAGLSHPNIVQFLGVYARQPDTRPGMVMPWFKNGNASHYLDTRKFSILEKFTLLYDIACGLAYLHTRSPSIVHGDLKAPNVLIDDEGRAMLCDFGVSRIIEEVSESTGTTTAGTVEGTLRWSAPEVISEEPARFTPESDVWSFGCTGYEIFTRKMPYYEHKTPGPIIIKIMGGDTPNWPTDPYRDATRQSNAAADRPEHIPDFITNFISRRWKFSPQERGKMNDIIHEMQSMLHSNFGGGVE